VIEPPPPPPPIQGEDPTARRHDGFYLRLGIGIARGDVKTEGTVESTLATASTNLDVTYSGYGPAYEILIGGTPGGGFVIGGGFVGQDIQNPDIEFNELDIDESELEGDDTLGMVVVGPFVDWFPDETGGAHVGAMLGIGGIGLSSGDDNDEEMSSGWGASLWAGYDFWVASQWAIGAEARAAYLSTKREFEDSFLRGDLDDRGTSFEILFTAVHH
jgi:hypothetical protein